MKLFKDTAKEDLHLLYATSVSRATSNMTAINWFYTEVLKATVVDSASTNGAPPRVAGLIAVWSPPGRYLIATRLPPDLGNGLHLIHIPLLSHRCPVAV